MNSQEYIFIKKLLLAIVVLLIVAGVGFAGIEITCSPWFCNCCHEMNIYYDTWDLCNHGSRGSCMTCHAQPGFLNFLKAKVNGFFSLVFHFFGSPHVEATLPVVCLREGCHVLERIDMGEYRSDTVKTVKMDHVRHVELTGRIGTRYECIPCHKNIAHARNRKFMPDMKDTCFICHSDADIRYQNCSICHPRHPRIEGEVDEIYEIHEGEGLECQDCHVDAHKANKISCMNCHDESYADLITFEIKQD